MHTLSVLDVRTLMYVDEVAEFDTEVVACDFIHLDLSFLDIVGAQANQHGVSPLFPPTKHIRVSVPTPRVRLKHIPDDDRIAAE